MFTIVVSKLYDEKYTVFCVNDIEKRKEKVWYEKINK